jgi:hypothetical protein
MSNKLTRQAFWASVTAYLAGVACGVDESGEMDTMSVQTKVVTYGGGGREELPRPTRMIGQRVGNVHGHRNVTRARTARAGTSKPSQLQHATTPPIWT